MTFASDRLNREPERVQTPWDRMSLKVRQTGRTTRMLCAAIRAAVQEHRAVYIVCANQRDVKRMEEMLDRNLEDLMGIKERAGIQIETWESLRASINFSTMQLRNAWPNCLVLYDHFAIESQYHMLLTELHRWDAVPLPPDYEYTK